MIKVALYSRKLSIEDLPIVIRLLDALTVRKIGIVIEQNLVESVGSIVDNYQVEIFSSSDQLISYGCQLIISLGGDGTLLDTLKYIIPSGLPVLGINLGRLGFLSNIPIDKIEETADCILQGHYKIESRTTLALHTSKDYFNALPFAINDFTIHKRDSGSMITIDTYLNGEFFNTYWCDGIIVSTPTGSTAYSLSCGGPIIFPESNNFVITPSAPHNLNIRPIIVPDTTVISFRVKGRGINHLISLDSRYEVIDYGEPIAIHKGHFQFKIARLKFQTFIQSLKEKLNWGVDPRNF